MRKEKVKGRDDNRRWATFSTGLGEHQVLKDLIIPGKLPSTNALSSLIPK
jgi:hypothetical protein